MKIVEGSGVTVVTVTYHASICYVPRFNHTLSHHPGRTIRQIFYKLLRTTLQSYFEPSSRSHNLVNISRYSQITVITI